MLNSDQFQGFNSELIRFISFASKQKSIQKILVTACELCSTLSNVHLCRIYALDRRNQSLILVTHTDVARKHATSSFKPLDIKMEALEKLKGEAALFDKADILIPIRGYREIFGVVHIKHNQSKPPESLFDILHPVFEFISKIITDMEIIADLKERLAKRDRLIQKKEALVEKKTLLAAEANHRVRNNLQIIHSMLINRIDEFKIYGDEAEITIRKIAGRIMAMAQVYDQLLVSGDKDIIQGDIYLNALLDDLIQIYGAQYPHIRIIRDIHCVKIKLSQASVIGIVLIELVTNAFIHAFPQSSGNIMVGLTKEAGRRHAILVVKDNGKGLDPSANNHRNGVRLVERLIEHINGRLTILNDMGTTFLLNFKP